MSASESLVLIEAVDRVATLRLNNPPVNAVSVDMLQALHAVLDTVALDRSIRCVILTGAGTRAFCAGADLREESRPRDADEGRAFRELGRRTLERLESFDVPIIAAIQGWCIGGGTALGWACDLRIAADTAKFRAGDAYLGIIPSWGMGLLRLPKLVGRAQVLDILLLGEDMSAARAYELGLVTRVVPASDLLDVAMTCARRIADGSPIAVRAIRDAVRYNLRHGWDEMAAYEEELSSKVFAHPDAQEGMRAFLEKRRPQFQDI